MTKVEREKYLLALNSTQRLALLFTLSNRIKGGDTITIERFDDMIVAYRPKENDEERGP